MNELVVRAGKGDVRAQEELLAMLLPRINSLVRRYSWISGVESDDLKQEAFVAIIEGLKRVNPEIGSSSEFLLKFARWRLLDSLKKVLRRKLELMPNPEMESDAGETILSAEAELLEGRLTDQQKSILNYLVQGYTWREIGQIMGFSAANIAYHLKQIRRIYG
jgi:RNA polymerase sigma factor (sigma-70 family)